MQLYYNTIPRADDNSAPLQQSPRNRGATRTERRRRRRLGGHLADAIDEVAEEEARGADEELLPPGAVREGDAEERPTLLLRSGHGASVSLSKERRMKEGSGQWPAGCAG